MNLDTMNVDTQQPVSPSGPALASNPAELRFTLSIKRADTGITEEVEMVGHIDPASLTALQTN